MSTAPLTADQAELLERCIAVGGVAVFPADTVYGLACDANNKQAVARLYAIKRRSPQMPSAVLWFSLELALASLGQLGPRCQGALERLLPGAVTLLLDNPQRRFPLACGSQPATLGIRVPALGKQIAALGAHRWPILQSSANRAGQPAPSRIADLAPQIAEQVDLVLDAGQLAGSASSVIDLRRYEDDGSWQLLREGPLDAEQLSALLD